MRRLPCLLAALLLVAAAEKKATAGRRTARAWDELRVLDVSPSKISTLPLSTNDVTGLGSWYKAFGFGKDWLRLEGAQTDVTLLSQSFEFYALDFPHEWAARSTSTQRLTLQVGGCNCRLGGVAAYTKDDQTAWLRLQFEECQGCESTAEHAAVIFGLTPSTEYDSNLYRWMCAVYPTALCFEPHKATEEPTTSTTAATTTTARTTTGEATVPPTTTITTTATNLHCSFLTVDTTEVLVGNGKCVGGHAVTTKPATSQVDCEASCDTFYLQKQIDYMGQEALNAHVADINAGDDVCKGYAYNAEQKLCTVYTRKGEAITQADGQDGWVCIGEFSVKENGYSYHHDYTSDGCSTTPAPLPTTTTLTSTTVTTTSITSTSTTTITSTSTTTTTMLETLNLAPWFGWHAGEPQLFSFPADVHFRREGLEATMLQLQSECFPAVDYYMLGGALPVARRDWAKLLQLLTHFGDPGAWSDRTELCAGSATIERIPVDVDSSIGRSDLGSPGRTSTSARWDWLAKLALTMLACVFVSLVGMQVAVRARGACHPVGVESADNMDWHRFCVYVGAAVLVACCTFALVYLLGLGFCWCLARLASKKLAMGNSQVLFDLPSTVYPTCQPMAAAAAGGAFVFWLWPTPEKQSRQLQPTNYSMTVELDPHSGQLRPLILPPH